MGRPREHDEETREALLDAAEALLAGDGPGAVSVRGVADAVGTTTRAVYSVLGSKAGLIEALAARGYRLLEELVSTIPITDDPIEDLVQCGLVGFRRFANERPHLFRLTWERTPPEIAAVQEVIDARTGSYGSLAARIEHGQQLGVLPPLPVPELAFSFHSFCQGLASNELNRLPPPVGAGFWQRMSEIDLEQVWRRSLEALLHGLRDAD